MTPKQWPDEIKMRAEKAMADLEAFWDRFRYSTSKDRQAALPKLTRIRAEIATITSGDEYTMECFSKFTGACRQLARLRQPREFDESGVVSYALGDLSNIRSWLARFGLLHDHLPPEAPM